MELCVFWNHIECAALQTGKPIQQILRLVKSFGIDGVECESPDTPEQSRVLLAQLCDAGLRVMDVYASLDLVHGVTDAQIDAYFDKVQALQSDRCLIIPGYRHGDEPMETIMQQTATSFAHACELGGKRQLTVMVEDFDNENSPCSTISQVKRLLDEVPALALAFDTGNFRFQEEDELAAFHALQTRIRHVHCKDRTFDASRGGKMQPTVAGRTMYPVAVGSGSIQMGKLLSGLKAYGYNGVLSIEHFDSPDQLGDIRRSAEWLRAAWI